MLWFDMCLPFPPSPSRPSLFLFLARAFSQGLQALITTIVLQLTLVCVVDWSSSDGVQLDLVGRIGNSKFTQVGVSPSEVSPGRRRRRSYKLEVVVPSSLSPCLMSA